MPRKARSHFEGLTIEGPCYLCNGAPACYGGQTAGYTTCQKCWNSQGPEERDCLPCFVSEFRLFRDKRGYAPFFAVRGPMTVKGRITTARRQPASGIRVVLAFPNGLCLTTRSDRRGRFAIDIESFERRPRRVIDLGEHPRGHESVFYIGFRLTRAAQN